MDYAKYDDIRPYSDAEAVAAFSRIGRNPSLPAISKYLFPQNGFWYLSQQIRACQSVDEFQKGVIAKVVEAIVDNSSYGFSYSGTEHLKGLEGKKFLVISNHRDIVLDPALIDYMFYKEGKELLDLCIGNNLIDNGFINDLMRSNRMVIVHRGISSKELYESSLHLSGYIRDVITSGNSSVWVAQKQGRAKDGIDRTSPTILKMLSLSGSGDFVEDFDALTIVPMCLSYEYESCDYLKTRELFLSMGGEYVKRRGEDTMSILSGIRQQKGGIHLEICKPISREELAVIAQLPHNERYNALSALIDSRIRPAYKLWKTNYIAADLLAGNRAHQGSIYDSLDLASFEDYTRLRLAKIGRRLDKHRDALRDIFRHIYANPLSNR